MAKKTLICYHWTAGTYKPNSTDLNSYQLLIGGDGTVYKGTNPNPSSITGLNSITYNIALCSMLGATEANCKKGIYGSYPITKVQLEKAWSEGAKVMKQLGIKSDRIFTHSVISQLYRDGKLCSTLGIQPNRWLANTKFKWDIDYLKDYPNLNRQGILDLFRQKVQWYYNVSEGKK